MAIFISRSSRPCAGWQDPRKILRPESAGRSWMPKGNSHCTQSCGEFYNQPSTRCSEAAPKAQIAARKLLLSKSPNMDEALHYNLCRFGSAEAKQNTEAHQVQLTLPSSHPRMLTLDFEIGWQHADIRHCNVACVPIVEFYQHRVCIILFIA